MKTWRQKADEAVNQGYMPGNAWERELGRHLESLFPQLVKELGKDLEAYCQVQTWEAMELADRLENQGTPPDVARDLAREQLLPRPPVEQGQTTEWEQEGGQASMEEAAEQFLTGR